MFSREMVSKRRSLPPKEEELDMYGSSVPSVILSVDDSMSDKHDKTREFRQH